MMQRYTQWIILVMLGGGLAACGPLSVMSSALTAGQLAMDERSAGSMVNDTGIRAQLLHHFLQSDVNDLLTNVDYSVHEGRVLLTGATQSQETMVRAVEIAWKPNGVREVINEIEVVDATSGKQFAKDVALSSQIEGRLLLAENVRSLNYNVEVVNGVVYLLGIAQNQQELETVTTIAGMMSGVKKVVSHVRMKDSPYRKM